MKAFTVYQPYAYAIVAGLKQYETRPGRTNIRGRVAVHAGKRRITKDDMEIVYREFPTWWPERYGVVVGTVEIVDCLPEEEVIPTLTERERKLGDYSPGSWAWVLKNPVMFDTPIPVRGKQGWWNWEGAGE